MSGDAQRGSLTRGVSFALLSFSFTATLALASSIATARVYGASVVGDAALALAPQSLLILLSSVQEQPALVRKIAGLPPRAPAATGLWVATFSFSTALTLTVGILVSFGSAWAFSGLLDRPDLIWPAIVGIMSYATVANTSWNLDSVLAANQDGRSLFWVRSHQAVLYLALLFVAATVTHSVWAIIIATVASYVTPLIHRVFLVRRWLTGRGWFGTMKESIAELPEIIRFGLKMTPGAIAGGASTEAGTWVLGATSTAAEIGVYNRAFSLSKRVSEVTWRVSEMVMPALVARRAAGDDDGLRRAWVNALRITTVCLGTIAAIGAGGSPAFMAMFGPDFVRGSTALAVLFITPVLMQHASLQNDLLVAYGRPGLITKLAIAGAVLSVLATIALASPFGAVGAAAGFTAGLTLRCVLGYWAINRVTGVRVAELWPWNERAALAVSCAATVAASYSAVLLLGPTVGAVVPATAFGVVAATLCVIGLKAVRASDLRMVADKVRAVRGRPTKTSQPS